MWPSPFQPSSTPEVRSAASARAQRYGVAGSRVVPTTRMGPAPAALIAAGGAAGTGQYAQGRLPHTIDAPNSGAARSAADAAACQGASDRGQGRSTQLTAVLASTRLE